MDEAKTNTDLTTTRTGSGNGAAPDGVPGVPERTIYLCPVCRIQWLTTAGAWACCEKVHRGGRSGYGDTLGRAGVQCSGRQLHRLRSIIRRAERDGAA